MNEIKIILELEKKLESLLPMDVKRRNVLDKKFRLEFNYNTNHIEGSTITYSETELLLIFDDAKGNHTLRELEEMKGSDVAFQLCLDLAKDNERPLTEQNIKYLNEILLVRPFWKDAITEDGQSTRRMIKVGDYKELPNSVRLQNGEIFEYANPSDTPILMGELIQWFREEEEKKELHPVILAALLHYKFVRIHPFDDGNGRVSRLLMNYVLFKNNLPPIIIKSDEKRNYLAALNRADTGDIESFTKFIASQLIWSLEISIKAAQGESIDEPGDLDKKIKLLKQKMKIGEEKVIIVKSREIILQTINNNIEPLLLAISEKLGEFNGLFKSSTEYLLTGSNAFGGNLKESIQGLKTSLRTKIYNNIEYKYIFKDFRNSNAKKVFTCSFTILFHNHIYEVIPSNGSIYIGKLYNESFAESEIKGLSELLGMELAKEIEEIIESN